MSTFLSLVSGAIGGNFAAGVFRSLSIGTYCNLIFGMLGGLLGGYLTAAISPETPELGSLFTLTFVSVLGGGALVCLAGFIRNLIRRR